MRVKYPTTLFLLGFILTCNGLIAQSLPITNSIIHDINLIQGITPDDSLMFNKIIFPIQNEPYDSIDFNKINQAIEKRKAVVSSDVYYALKYVLLRGLINRFGKIDSGAGVNFGLQLIEQLKDAKTPIQRELLFAAISRVIKPYCLLGQMKEGILYFSELSLYYKTRNDSDAVSMCYYVLMDFYQAMGLIDRAIYAQKKSISYLNDKEIKREHIFLFTQPNSLIGVAGKINRYSVLAQIYLNNGEPAKALQPLYESLNAITKLKNPAIFRNTFNIFLQMSRAQALINSDSADYYFALTKPQIMLDNEEVFIYKLHYLQEIGYAFYLKNNTDSATHYLTECLNKRDSFQVQVNSAPGNLIPGYYLSLVKTRQAKYNEALQLLKNEIELIKAARQNFELAKAYKLIANVFSLSKKYAEATHYYELLFQLQADLAQEEKVNRSISFEIEQTILTQEKDSEDKSRQLQKQKVIRNSFIAGSILLLLLIVVLINRNKLKRSMEMEKMRSRLSRDLHDDIGSTLSSINILSRTAQSNLKQNQDDKTKASLEKINERSQRLLDNMSDIIWNINPGNDTIEEVMSRMREYATTILEAKNIEYTFNFPKETMDCKLSMEVKNNMYLIFKEAVNNLSKYSGCSKANLSLTFNEKNIHLTIEDNGKGFIDDEIKHRGGLRNMQHRAEEIKGAIEINSVIERGTLIELTMPRYC